MKIMKAIGIILLVAAIVMSLGIIGKVETEDAQLKAGEIEIDQVLSDSALITLIGISITLAIVGGLILAVRFWILNSHLPLLDRRSIAVDVSERPFTVTLSTAAQVVLTDNDYIGVVAIRNYLYALYLTEDEIYVLTDTKNPGKQYWAGNITELMQLEAKYDNEQ